MMVLRFVITAPLLLALGSCGSSSTTPVTPEATATPTGVAPGTNTQQFRIVNGSPGTGAVDAYIYPAGGIRPAAPVFASVPFGAITPYIRQVAGAFVVDILRAGAVSTQTAIVHFSFVGNGIGTGYPKINTLVVSGTNLSNTRNIQYFLEPSETAGESALVVHHASPAANLLTAQNPIGIGVYSTGVYPPGTAAASIAPRATQQLFTLTFQQNPAAAPLANMPTVGAGAYFLMPFPAAPLPAAVGFAIGLPSTSAATNAPLASILSNAALSETANENSPYAGQNALTNDALETVPAGTHISEFLIDADQNGNVGLIGTVDP